MTGQQYVFDDESRYKFLSGSEVGKLPLLKAIHLAIQAYKGENVFSKKRHIDIFNKNPDSYIFALDRLNNDTVVGCILAIPVTDYLYERTISGTFDEESELRSEHILPLNYKGRANMYFCSITCDPKASNRVAILRGLMMKFMRMRARNLREGKRILSMSAIAISDSGRHLCTSFGMRFLFADKSGNHIFEIKNLSKILYENHLTGEEKSRVLRDIIAGVRKKTENG